MDDTVPVPSRLRYALLLLVTVPLGSVVRFSPLHLPHWVGKYGGSALWAIAIFWLVSLLRPFSTLPVRAGAALSLAFAIEFFKLVRTPALDAFRLTLPGKLLLGSVFSPRDLLAYSAGVLCAGALDHFLFTAQRHSRGQGRARA